MASSTSRRLARQGLLLAARTSSSGAAAVIAVVTVVCATLIFVVVFMAAALTSSADSAVASDNTQPSSYARSIIPADMLRLYMSDRVRSECPGLSWTVVAAIIHLESADNRNPGTSSAGARGASQFMPATWDRASRPIVNVGSYGRIPDGQGYGLDGDGDGLADIMNPLDSVPATARYLCDHGAGDPAKVPKAVYAYNHAWWYVNGGMSDAGTHFIGVLPLAAKLGEPATTTSLGWQNPLRPGSYTLTSPFGMRFHPVYHYWKLHSGQDMGPNDRQQGAPIYAVANGKVLSVTSEPTGHGNYVIIDHGKGVQSAYAHLRNFAPATIPGSPVRKGQVIGYMGNTGTSTATHLHFEIKVNGEFVDPVPWMEAHGVKL